MSKKPEPVKKTFTIERYAEYPSMDIERKGKMEVTVIIKIGEGEFLPITVHKEEWSEEYAKQKVKAYLEEKAKWEGKTFTV